MSHTTGLLAGALRRLSGTEIRNLVAAIRSIYDCQTQSYSLSWFDQTMAHLTVDERQEVIAWVLRQYGIKREHANV